MADVRYLILQADKEGMPPYDGVVYTDPEKAAADARVLSKTIGEKLIVKPVMNNKWREREELRIKRGEYRPMPWLGQSWWHHPTAIAIWKDQYPHPSIERPGWLAYTKNAEDGMKDKQTVVRPGAYLKRYFTTIMNHYGCSERKLVEQFMLAYGPIEIKFAATEDEIIAVYEHGPQTCMRDRTWPVLSGFRNPAQIYAAGDLQVAYLGSLEKATARTLVWPEKKIFSRVYGDIARLTSGLERLGYKWGAPIGAKLKRIEANKVKFDPQRGTPSHCFIAPYIDKKNQAGGGHLSIMDKGDHLIICEEGVPGSHHCGLADGYTGQYIPRNDEYPTFTCDHCGVPGHKALHTVRSDPDGGDEYSWCMKCTARHAFRCGYSGAWYPTDEVEHVKVDGEFWCQYYADMYAATCEMTKQLTHQDNLIDIWIDSKLRSVSPGWIENEGGYFTSGVSRRKYLRRDRVLMNSDLHCSMYIAKDEMKYHAFRCDSCEAPWELNDRHEFDGKLLCERCFKQPVLAGIQKRGKPKRNALDELRIEFEKEPF